MHVFVKYEKLHELMKTGITCYTSVAKNVLYNTSQLRSPMQLAGAEKVTAGSGRTHKPAAPSSDQRNQTNPGGRDSPAQSARAAGQLHHSTRAWRCSDGERAGVQRNQHSRPSAAACAAGAARHPARLRAAPPASATAAPGSTGRRAPPPHRPGPALLSGSSRCSCRVPGGGGAAPRGPRTTAPRPAESGRHRARVCLSASRPAARREGSGGKGLYLGLRRPARSAPGPASPASNSAGTGGGHHPAPRGPQRTRGPAPRAPCAAAATAPGRRKRRWSGGRPAPASPPRCTVGGGERRCRGCDWAAARGAGRGGQGPPFARCAPVGGRARRRHGPGAAAVAAAAAARVPRAAPAAPRRGVQPLPGQRLHLHAPRRPQGVLLPAHAQGGLAGAGVPGGAGPAGVSLGRRGASRRGSFGGRRAVPHPVTVASLPFPGRGRCWAVRLPVPFT